MLKLGVNIDHIATVRQARKAAAPRPLEGALLAEKAGAWGITAHLREDRRHIQDADIRELAAHVKNLNMEMASMSPGSSKRSRRRWRSFMRPALSSAFSSIRNSTSLMRPRKPARTMSSFIPAPIRTPPARSGERSSTA